MPKVPYTASWIRTLGSFARTSGRAVTGRKPPRIGKKKKSEKKRKKESKKTKEGKTTCN